VIVMSADHSVREFMTSPVSSLASTAPLLDAALLLRSTHIRHIPILEGETLVGILTDRDVQRCTPSRLSRVSAEEYNSIFQNTVVATVMTREPHTVAPDTPLQEAVNILRTGKLGCLPVLENGKLVGIITKDDMLAALFALLTGAPAIR
jgi:CBS domain-containing protein